MSNLSKVLVIIPVHNEASTLSQVISEVRAAAPEFDILVVDDASRDESARVACESGEMLATLPFNLGIGGAVQTGFKFARRRRYGCVVQVDGDGQHDPSFIRHVVGPVLSGQADITIGSRRLHSDDFGSSFTRRVGMRFFSWLTSRATSINISDCSSGFRALSEKAYRLFSTDYPVDFPDAEAIIKAHRAGLRICEVPVHFRERNGGKSSLRSWRLLYYPFKETLSILVMLTRRPRNAP